MPVASPSIPNHVGLPESSSLRAAPRYVVEHEIASGGMGVVYRVVDRVAGEPRAMKRLSVEMRANRAAVGAFEREYHVLASLKHPSIISVFDYGVDELGPYYTMELLEGQDMREAAPLSFPTACLHLRDIATSLALLHARRLIHRDLSPNNVRMTKDGRCKLFDFGALTSFGYSPRVVGTPPVISPEAFAGSSLDQRTDLYALGALAYWMLTGQHAYGARDIAELPAVWSEMPRRPSSLVRDIPKELDMLVLSLLHRDPLARPGSAAEVIARLTVIGDLPPEDAGETERLADSFLVNPRFTGRREELRVLQTRIDAAKEGQGGAVCIRARSGMGRSRLLDEAGVRAQLAGATVIRADAATRGQGRDVLRALVLRALDVVPQLALKHASRFRSALVALGSDVEARIGPRPAAAAALPQGADGVATTSSLYEWFGEISRERPLLIEVDNVEFVDPDSLVVLIALAKLAFERPILLIVTESTSNGEQATTGLQVLQSCATSIELSGLSPGDMLDFARSLFGDAPNVERFASWLAERTAGSPLHAVETCRQLATKQIIRYQAGIWTLPLEKPETDLPAAIEDAFSSRLAALSDPARALAECLSLHRDLPTFELCRRLVSPAEERRILEILDELALADVLYADREGYRFSSTALREALLGGMDEQCLERNHRRLGEDLAERAGADEPALRIEAGWHLIQGGDESRGADMIAAVTCDAVIVRTLTANRFRAGAPIEAALKVYRRERRTIHERMPLLAALAQAGYYEDRSWGERYGDEALDVLERLSGLSTARFLRRFLGGRLAIVFGLCIAFLRFQFVPRSERKYSFGVMMIQLFSVATTLTAVASLTLDPARVSRVAASLEPFAVLPSRLTPVGIYEYCRGLALIAGEYEAEAYELFGRLIGRLDDPRYYPTLRADARTLYLAGAHVARGSCAIFHADGKAALESADALDRTGLQLYAMVASQLRVLYYSLRGEVALAAPHQEKVEIHAAQIGSAWQVETWGTLALALLYSGPLRDIVSATRVVHRLELLTRTVPELRKHCQFTKASLMLARGEASFVTALAEDCALQVPRKNRGWAARQALLAQGYNELGRYAEARAVCARTTAHMTDADRDYVMLFLLVDREFAIADAGLGHVAEGLGRIDGLLARFANCDHPLVHGLLHEARAQISWRAGDAEAYARSLLEVERWFRPTGTPALIDKYEKLASLPRTSTESVPLASAAAAETPSRIAVTPERQLERTLTGDAESSKSVGPSAG